MFRPPTIMLLAWLLSLVSVSAVVSANAYDYGFNVGKLVRRQDSSTRIVVNKLPLAANGSVPVRPEIRDMRKDKYTWDLFILALSMLQYVSQDHPLSWYQIAGIHGVPFRSWNGVGPVTGAEQSGYCTHSSVLFPTWHRPYLALYEQEMYKLVNAIARLFPNATEKTQYQQAASVFRIPYWDWSIMAPAGETHLPEPFWSPMIAQYGPNGMQNIRNPLYSYMFHPLDENDLIWAPLKYWNETKRAPNTDVSKTAPPSRNDVASAALLSKLPEIQQRLYILFSRYHDFNSFSNKAWAASHKSTSLDSLESVHDIIHVYGGAKGHMTYVPLSSFDPLFFLHHAMTDRLFAMWQILNPRAWIVPMAAGETTYTALKGTMQSSTTPLTPFYSSQDGTFWTSDSARETDVFGYTYADTNLHPQDTDTARQTLIKKINSLYGASSPMGMQAKAKEGAPNQSVGPRGPRVRKEITKTFGFNIKMAAKDPPVEAVVHNNRYVEWIANIQVNVEALDGRFSVHLFLGSPPADPKKWDSAQNQIGSVAIFAMNRMTGSQSKISGALPLTSALMKVVASGELSSLSARHVVPFLETTLEMRIQASDDSAVDPKEVDGLRINVSSANVTMPMDDTELPEWGEAVRRIQVW